MLILWLIGITMVLLISVPDQLVCGDYNNHRVPRLHQILRAELWSTTLQRKCSFPEFPSHGGF